MAVERLLFDGLKVVDAGSWVAGPVAATILGDFGADVIKIEVPGGDPFRNLALGGGTPNADINYAWAQDARGKRSIALNVKTSEGLSILKKLAARCDVFLTNYPLPMRRELGLMYEDLKPFNETMIYASLTAYGELGPERDREGFDSMAYWARSGLMDLVRSSNAPPAHSIAGMGDHPTAISLYASIVTALLHRERTGEGSMVHTSLIQNGLWAASCIAGAQFAHGADYSGYPNRDFKHFARELYETSDGRWLMFAMLRNPDQIYRLFDLLGLADVLVDERFSTARGRIEYGEILVDKIRKIIKSHPCDHWVDTFDGHDIPHSVVQQVDEWVNDPQLHINEFVREPNEDIGANYVIDHPINVTSIESVGIQRAPDVGEHTSDILRQLGYSDDEIAYARAAGAFAPPLRIG